MQAEGLQLLPEYFGIHMVVLVTGNLGLRGFCFHTLLWYHLWRKKPCATWGFCCDLLWMGFTGHKGSWNVLQPRWQRRALWVKLPQIHIWGEKVRDGPHHKPCPSTTLVKARFGSVFLTLKWCQTREAGSQERKQSLTACRTHCTDVQIFRDRMDRCNWESISRLGQWEEVTIWWHLCSDFSLYILQALGLLKRNDEEIRNKDRYYDWYVYHAAFVIVSTLSCN